MDDGDADLSNIILHIFEKQNKDGSDIQHSDKFKCVNIGKTYLINVILCFPSCVNGNVNDWRLRIQKVHGHVNFHVLKSQSDDQSNAFIHVVNNDVVQCNSYHSVADSKHKILSKDLEPYFADNTTYILPLEATVDNIRSRDKRLYLTVTVIKPSPCPRRMFGEYDFLLDLEDVKPLPEKENTHTQQSVSRTLKIHQPPMLQVKYKDVSGQFMVFMDLKNQSLQDIFINDTTLLKGSCPYCEKAVSQHRDIYNDIGACKGCDHAVHMVTGSLKFPVKLGRAETLSLIFALYKHNIEGDTSELVLNTHIKWGTEINQPQAVTVYKMPRILLRRMPFILDVDYDRTRVNIGESFKVTYTVRNLLQDFQEWRLYWNPVLPTDIKQDYPLQTVGQSPFLTKYILFKDDEYTHKLRSGLGQTHIKCDENHVKTLEDIKSGLVCHDPTIKFGKLPYGSTVSRKVDFTILKPGLYELGKHMKLNLTYDVPESPVKQPFLGSPEGLWRDRISSASSYGGDRELEEKRMSFGKSYSFGDMGSQESDHFESIQLNTDVLKKRTVVSTDFKKNSCQIYVPLKDV